MKTHEVKSIPKVNCEKAFGSFNSYVDSISNVRIKSYKKNCTKMDCEENAQGSVQSGDFNNNTKCNYMVSVNTGNGEQDDLNYHSVLSEITVNKDSVTVVHQGNSTTTAYDIVQLEKFYDVMLTQLKKDENALWKFTYIDQNIAKLDLYIEKTNKNNLLITMSTASKDLSKVKQIISDLHSKLMQKGWGIKIKQQKSITYHGSREELENK